MKLEEGMYEISADVKNPKPDRRKAKRNFDAREVWPKGMRVLVERDILNPDVIRIYKPGGYSHLGVKGRPGGKFNHPGWEALAAVLRPVEMTAIEWVKNRVPMHADVLAQLLSDGKLSKADIEKAVENVKAQEE